MVSFLLHGIGSFCIKGLAVFGPIWGICHRKSFVSLVKFLSLSEGFSSFCSSLVFMFVYVGREYLYVGVSVHVCVCVWAAYICGYVLILPL